MAGVRFVRQDKEQVKKVLEEAAEVYGAWQLCPVVALDAGTVDSCNGAPDARRKLLGECADVCQAVANLLASMGVTKQEWAEAVDACYSRNELRGRFS